MVVHDVTRLLRREGLPAADWRIRYAVKSGRVVAPPRDSFGHRRFGPEHIEALREYFGKPHKGPGRPRTVEPLAVA